jgi:hypothetical protein
MTAAAEVLDLTHRLLAYESDAGETSEPLESPTLRVYEKLRQSLGALAGATAFQSLAARALALAKLEVPSLSAARVIADGSLQDLGEFGSQVDDHKDQAGEYPVGEGGTILIARLLGLLFIFLGEALTLILLRSAWPGETFDDLSSGNGRES